MVVESTFEHYFEFETRGARPDFVCGGLCARLCSGDVAAPTNFTDSTIFNFAWSRDGGQLVLARGAVNSDVVLMGNAAIRIASGSTNPLHPTYSHKIRLSSHRL